VFCLSFFVSSLPYSHHPIETVCLAPIFLWNDNGTVLLTESRDGPVLLWCCIAHTVFFYLYRTSHFPCCPVWSISCDPFPLIRECLTVIIVRGCGRKGRGSVLSFHRYIQGGSRVSPICRAVYSLVLFPGVIVAGMWISAVIAQTWRYHSFFLPLSYLLGVRHRD
jgi:hypothetical protein